LPERPYLWNATRRHAHECESKIPRAFRHRLSEIAVQVPRLYEAWRKPEKAAEWKSKLGIADLPADVFARP
jgi:hypothetical protein